MADPAPTFGKRGARVAQTPAPSAEPEKSAAYREVAAAARAALSQREAIDDDAPRSAPLPQDDMAAYIGPRWSAYRRLWASMEGAPGLRWRRSFGAAAFSSLWLLYRKQYVLGIGALVAQAAMLQTEPTWNWLFDFGIASVCGHFGMSIVLLSGARAIPKARARAASAEIAAVRIAAAGGVDLVAALAGAALLTGVALAKLSGALSGFELRAGDARSLVDMLGSP